MNTVSNVFQRSLCYICEYLYDIDNVIIHLISKEVITFREGELINSKDTKLSKNFELVKILQGKDDRDVLYKFITVLENCNYSNIAQHLKNSTDESEANQGNKELTEEMNEMQINESDSDIFSADELNKDVNDSLLSLLAGKLKRETVKRFVIQAHVQTVAWVDDLENQRGSLWDFNFRCLTEWKRRQFTPKVKNLLEDYRRYGEENFRELLTLTKQALKKH